MASCFYNKHPREDCEHAIESMPPVGGLQGRGGAAPIQAGDETTWLGGGPRCRWDPAEDPHAEDEEARAYHDVERGTANLMATDCDGRRTPSQRERRKDPNL
jgi:hypothetical protein